MSGVLSFLCHLTRFGEPPDQLSPCTAVEVARSPSTICPSCLICSHNMTSKPSALLLFRILLPLISSSMVKGDAGECSVMWLPGILAFDGRCVGFPLPFSKIL